MTTRAVDKHPIWDLIAEAAELVDQDHNRTVTVKRNGKTAKVLNQRGATMIAIIDAPDAATQVIETGKKVIIHTSETNKH